MRKSAYLIAVFILLALTGCSNTSPLPAKTVPLEPGNTIASPTVISVDELNTTTISPIDRMTLVFVPAGEFKMGSELGLTDEQPVHTVMLDAFWLDKTEVTNAMYNLCVQAGQCDIPNLIGSFEGQENSSNNFYDQEFKDHPVTFVSWNDAKNYCTWAGRRLPTEAEWEKAATWNPITNEQQVYPWGNKFNCKMGNYDDEIELDASLMPDTYPNCDGFSRISPTGSFPEGASPYGALDMGGNVWEWVNDAFIETDPITNSANYYANSPVYNPPGVDPAITEYRIVRGGSWNMTFGFGRAAYRLWFGLDDSYDGVGFRCARSQ